MSATRRLGLPLLLTLAFTGCASNGSPTSPTRGFRVVAAEDVWGSIAAQLGGDRATVTSIITNPGTDPHAYEPTPSDARRFAAARVEIVNGLGYDSWASDLLAADGSGRSVLDIGSLLHLGAGANPHQWYAPGSLLRAVAAITAAYDRADPSARAYFAAREHHFVRVSLARYDALRAEIRRRFAGVPVGYSESIFQPLGASLGLRLLTPPGFADAIAEGAEVSAQDKETVERQARNRLIAVWVFNSQNLTPEVDAVNAIARSRGIPVVSVTETLAPATATFEQWQVAQLERLLAALHRATGR